MPKWPTEEVSCITGPQNKDMNFQFNNLTNDQSSEI